MEKKLVSSQSAERAGAPANAGNDDQPLAFGLYDVPFTNGACFPGLGNAFRETPPATVALGVYSGSSGL
jgi:hypothetical protein